MAKWQPPIPAGALWSPEAIALGPALSLLGYTYDLVQTDGTFEINLHEVADALNVAYPTLKRWWSQLRAGPFFAKVTDQGRRGMLVKFAEDWLDRRALEKRESKSRSQMIPNDPNPTEETGSQMISNDDNSSQSVDNRSIIGTETGSLLNAPYIGTHNTQGDMSQSVAQAPTAPTPEKPKKRALESVEKTQAELFQTPLAIYQRITNIRKPNQTQRELIATVEDLDVWKETCEFWALHGYNARSVPNLVDRYQKNLADRRKQQAALAARQRPTAYFNGANGYHAPTEPRLSIEEAALRSAELAKQYDPFNERGGK